MTKACVVCGKAFTQRRNQRCCSLECSREMRLKRRRTDWLWKHPDTKKAGTVAKCPVCGSDFIRTGAQSVYCSKRCFLDARTARRHHAEPKVVESVRCQVAGNTQTKVCVVCGKVFETRRPNAKCCSEKCAHRWRHPLVPQLDKVCVFCGKPFKTHNSTARCCSKLCADRHRRGWASLADYEKAQTERKASAERDRNGLTIAEIQEVIDVQNGDQSQLWKRSQSWTKAQHKYAKKRYEELHGLFAMTFNP